MNQHHLSVHVGSVPMNQNVGSVPMNFGSVPINQHHLRVHCGRGAEELNGCRLGLRVQGESVSIIFVCARACARNE